MRRISVTIPEDLAEALDRIVELDPLKPSRSKVVSKALMSYIASRYPHLLRRGEAVKVKGPSVLAALKSARPRAPSPTLRRGRLRLPRWTRVEG